MVLLFWCITQQTGAARGERAAICPATTSSRAHDASSPMNHGKHRGSTAFMPWHLGATTPAHAGLVLWHQRASTRVCPIISTCILDPVLEHTSMYRACQRLTAPKHAWGPASTLQATHPSSRSQTQTVNPHPHPHATTQPPCDHTTALSLLQHH